MTSEDGGIGNWHQLTPWCRAVGCDAGRLRMESKERAEGRGGLGMHVQRAAL